MASDIRRGASSLAEIAETIRQDILSGIPETDSVRLLFGFADDFRGSGPAGKVTLITVEPPPTGARKFDAALAGLAEFFAGEAGLPPPEWVNSSNRLAEPWFFIPATPWLNAYALAHAPIAFARRGVFMAKEVFDRA